MMGAINAIVEECSSQPEKTRGFFIRKTVLTKCMCGDSFGFHTKDALEFAGITSVTEHQLKHYIRNAKIGCCGRLTFQGRGQISGCIHIQRKVLSKELLAKLDNAFTSTQKSSAKTNSSATPMLQTKSSTVGRLIYI
ncbi:uncharacterized protein LOC116297095 [Actinia tenebrosa]|uniref:Uncharacterized protein LOC116297095 n=1 Tax=Actinia tenebrosa TaxID=6105 RepID=A0A6P8HXL2_ACTTE|nr:uncharacterized protein LOC116297095 [Actinia tenebrosa]